MQISDEMVEKAERVYWDATNDPEGARDMRAALEAALSTDAEPTIYVSRKSLEELLEAKGNHVALQTLIHRKPLKSGNGVALYAAPFAGPVKTAPAVAVKADLPERFEEWWAGRDSKGEKTLDYNQRKQLAWDAFYAAALSAQVQNTLGLEGNPETLRWWCQKLLDIIENYDISHDAPEEELAMLNDIRDAVDPASPASKHGVKG